MTVRNYTSAAPSTTLAGAITNVATSLTVASSSGYPSTPFVAIINRDLADEEAVYVTNVFGTNWTVTRGYDGTTALSHLSGAKVEHGVTAIEFREANAHNNATSDVHGVTGGLKTYIDAGDTTNSSALTTHAALTSGVHGVTGSIQSRLTATEGVANAATTSANTANTTANTATTNLATHIANGTGVHGVTGSLKGYIDNSRAAHWCHITHPVVNSIPNATLTDLDFTDATLGDPDGWLTIGSPDRIKPGYTGKYIISVSCQFDPTSASGARALYVYLKGNAGTTDHLVGASTIPANIGALGLAPALCVTGTHIIANVADYFYAKVYQNSGGSLNVLANTVHVSVGFLGV